MNLEQWRNWVDEVEAAPVAVLLDRASPEMREALKRSLERPGADSRRGIANLHGGGATTCARW